MPRQRHRAILDGILLSITALFVLGGLVALGFLQNVSRENRALIIIISSVGIICCLVGLVFISAFWKWLRKRIWRRAIATWKESSQVQSTPKFDMTGYLSEDELRQLAIQIYSRMGYRIANRENVKEYLQLINPDGRIELISCKQQPDLIELHHVYSLELEMKRTKAARGFLWAPAGFTSEAIDWVAHRSIVLADQLEIGRLVDCARAKGSRLLEC
jgi:hypothetical protein